MSTPKPATPLPWTVGKTTRIGGVEIQSVDINAGDYAGEAYTPQDAAYIAHAANAYPRLVEALRKSMQHCDQLSSTANTIAAKNGLGRKVHPEDFTEHAAALLRELGESA